MTEDEMNLRREHENLYLNHNIDQGITVTHIYSEEKKEEVKQKKVQNEREAENEVLTAESLCTELMKLIKKAKDSEKEEDIYTIIANNIYKMRLKMLHMEKNILKTYSDKQLIKDEKDTWSKILTIETCIDVASILLKIKNFEKAEMQLLIAETLSTKLMKEVKKVLKRDDAKKDMQKPEEVTQVPDYESKMTVGGIKEDVINFTLNAKRPFSPLPQPSPQTPPPQPPSQTPPPPQTPPPSPQTLPPQTPPQTPPPLPQTPLPLLLLPQTPPLQPPQTPPPQTPPPLPQTPPPQTPPPLPQTPPPLQPPPQTPPPQPPPPTSPPDPPQTPPPELPPQPPPQTPSPQPPPSPPPPQPNNREVTSEQISEIQRVKQANDDYDILGIPIGSQLDEVKKAYKHLTMILHPDHNRAPGANEAYMIMKEASDRLKSKLKSKKSSKSKLRFSFLSS